MGRTQAYTVIPPACQRIWSLFPGRGVGGQLSPPPPPSQDGAQDPQSGSDHPAYGGDMTGTITRDSTHTRALIVQGTCLLSETKPQHCKLVGVDEPIAVGVVHAELVHYSWGEIEHGRLTVPVPCLVLIQECRHLVNQQRQCEGQRRQCSPAAHFPQIPGSRGALSLSS